MQNKHTKNHFNVDQLAERGGGAPPVGPKPKLFPFFLKAPLSKEYRQQIIKGNKDTDKDNDNCTMNAKQ